MEPLWTIVARVGWVGIGQGYLKGNCVEILNTGENGNGETLVIYNELTSIRTDFIYSFNVFIYVILESVYKIYNTIQYLRRP